MEFCDGFRKLLDHLQLDKVKLRFPTTRSAASPSSWFSLTLSPSLSLAWWRFIFSARPWVDSWPKSLPSALTNPPECTPWYSVTHSATPPSSTRRGPQTGGKIIVFSLPTIRFPAASLYYRLTCVSLPRSSFWLMPSFMLKKIVLGNFAKGLVDPKMADAIDFMVDRVSPTILYVSFRWLVLMWRLRE